MGMGENRHWGNLKTGSRMPQTTNTRGANRLALLRMIRNKGPISRVQLAKELQLSKSTVTENIAPLLQEEVILEVGEGVSHDVGGRKPVLLKINGVYRYIIAAELGLQKPIFALTDLNGKIMAQHTVSIPEKTPYTIRLKAAAEIIQALLQETGVLKKQLAVIALSSPGAYSNFKQDYVLNPEFENWNVVQFTADLKKIFSTQVFLFNDVNSAAVGELFLGAGRGAQNLLYLSCGLGVGAGVILNGSLYTGKQGSAGEFASISPPGLPGALQTKVNLGHLMKRIRQGLPTAQRQILGKPVEEMDFHDVVSLWQSGDPFVTDCVKEVAVTLGKMMALIVSLLNCDTVIFGGEYLAFENQVLPILNDIIRREAFDPVPVVPAQLREESGLQGLLALSTDFLLSRIALKEA